MGKLNKVPSYLWHVFTILILVMLSNITRGDSNIDSLQLLLNQPGISTNQIDILLQLASEYKNTNKHHCRDYASKALELAKAQDDEQSVVDALILLGPLLNNPLESSEAFNKAYKIAERISYNMGMIRSLNGLGINCYYIGRYEKALNYYQQAYDFSQEIESDEGKFMVLNNLGILHGAFNNEEVALQYLHEALQLGSNLSDSNRLSITYNNLGSIYIKLEDYSKALEYQKKSLDIKYKDNDVKGITSSLNNIGALYMELNNLDQALINFHEAYKYAQSNHDKQALAYTNVNMGSLYLRIGKEKEAYQVLIQAERIAKEIDAKIYLKEIYQMLSYLNRHQCNFQKALHYANEYGNIKDSIFSAENQRIINEMQAKYELEKKEQKISYLAAYADSQSKIKGLFIILSLLVLLTAGIFISGIKRRNALLKRNIALEKLENEKILLEQREQENENLRLQEEMYANEEINRINREKQLEELSHKSRELSASALNILSKNEILIKIKDKLSRVDSKDRHAPLHKELLKLIDDNLTVEEDWENFRIHFEQVHSGFFENLLKSSSQITNNDLRLCAYLRIGMNSKEIARILNISPNSVDQRRYRLRKKLDLHANVSLSDYINKL